MVVCIGGPLIIIGMIAHYALHSRVWLKSVLQGYALVMALTVFIVLFLKKIVCRPRPNFIAMCGWKDGMCTSVVSRVLV